MDATSIDEYVESLKFSPRDPVTWDYDREADVLYISFGEPEPAIAADAGEGVLIRFRESDGMIVGVTIMGVSRMLMTSAARSSRSAGRRRAKPVAKSR